MENVAYFVSLDVGGDRLDRDKIYFGAACISLRHEIMNSHIRWLHFWQICFCCCVL